VLKREPATQIALLGSPKDQDACADVAAALPADAAVFNLAGATSLPEAIALIARAAAVVANDSGLLHIASALNRPVLALYGPTDPDHAPPFSDLAGLAVAAARLRAVQAARVPAWPPGLHGQADARPGCGKSCNRCWRAERH
jgi:lipopolysaccharide heptosyltransferase II